MAEEDLLSAARRVCRFFNIDMNKGGLITEHTEGAMEILDREWRKEAERRKTNNEPDARPTTSDRPMHGPDEEGS